jgi:hypothetical protein
LLAGKQGSNPMLAGTLHGGNHILLMGTVFTQQAVIGRQQIQNNEFSPKRAREQSKHMPCNLVKIATRRNGQGKIVQYCQAT